MMIMFVIARSFNDEAISGLFMRDFINLTKNEIASLLSQ